MNDQEKLPAADRILDILDGLANKLGIAASEIWKFSLQAKRVDACRDVVVYGLMLVFAVVAWSWTFHVANMKLPTEMKSSGDFITVPDICDEVDVYGKIIHKSCMKTVEKKTEVPGGISDYGQFLAISAIICAIAGVITLIIGACGVIGSIADFYKIEYNAYDGIIRGLTGKAGS